MTTNSRSIRIMAANPGSTAVLCPDCDEEGEIDGEPCVMCGGTGEAVIDEDGDAISGRAAGDSIEVSGDDDEDAIECERDAINAGFASFAAAVAAGRATED